MCFTDSLSNRIKIEYRVDISSEEIRRVIGKLKLDGFVEVPHTQYVRISFDGYIFEENGGYAAKALIDANVVLLAQTEIDRRRTLDDLLALNSTRLNSLTKWLTVGTIAAAVAAFGLLGWQIYSSHNPEPTPIILKVKIEKKP